MDTMTIYTADAQRRDTRAEREEVASLIIIAVTLLEPALKLSLLQPAHCRSALGRTRAQRHQPPPIPPLCSLPGSSSSAPASLYHYCGFA